MDKFQRIFTLHQILSHRRYPVSVAILAEQLECSESSVKRAIKEMRDWVNAPIKYDRKVNGYHYHEQPGELRFDLPGLWFNSGEIHALLSMEQLLRNLEPGFLALELSPIRKRLKDIQEKMGSAGKPDIRRMKVLGIGQRDHQPESFQQIATALFERKQLKISYHARSSDERTRRMISPQRLVHYRHNWYLDAWCHTRRALRIFSLERICVIQSGRAAAKEIDLAELDKQLAGAYGIFSGEATDLAILKFSPERARWVKDEYWHPEQQLTMLADGSCQLTIPYADDRELIQDILKHGRHVEVISTISLRKRVINRIAEAGETYKESKE